MATWGSSRTRAILSVVGVIVAFGLAGLAVVLICFGNTHKQSQLGVIAGLWSALLGYLSIYGVRHRPGTASGSTGSDLELASSRQLETTRDAASRREYEERLQALVQAELAKFADSMSSELDSLRAEVAHLRGDLVEKVGGQLRLERVETTRVIGSNIEALQHEVRRLAVGRDDPPPLRPVEIAATAVTAASGATPPPAVPPTATSPAAAPSAASAPLPPAPAPAPAAAPPAPPPVVSPPISVAPPIVVAPPWTPPVKTPIPVVATAPAASPPGRDPFADLPRLTPFVDDAPDAREGAAVASVAPVTANRHAAPEPVESARSGTSGGRRHRADDTPNEILERLLSRRTS